MKGSYILIIELPREQAITIGSLKTIRFYRGYYAYIGSAMNGLESRLNRHLKTNKRLHWHIDYLLQQASINGIILCETSSRIECAIAQTLSHQFDSIPGFGSSDCKCHSHLFFATDEKQMKSRVMANINLLDVKPKLIENKGLASYLEIRKERIDGHHRGHTVTKEYTEL